MHNTYMIESVPEAEMQTIHSHISHPNQVSLSAMTTLAAGDGSAVQPAFSQQHTFGVKPIMERPIGDDSSNTAAPK